MGRIVVHIGTHKTGTTSIQKTLSKNRKVLLREGILYPDYSMLRLGRHYAHIGMANALAGEHPKFSVRDAEKFFLRAQNAAEDRKVTLLSAEPLYRQILADRPPQDIKTAKEYWDARDRFIARFRELIGPAEIAMVVRRQDEFAESMYQEQVKVTRFSRDFKSFVKSFWFHFDYLAQADAWARHFPTVRIVPFEKLKGRDITQRFLTALDITVTSIVDEPMQNVGMPHDGVILKRAANGSPMSREMLDQLSAVLQGDTVLAALPSTRRSFFSSADKREAFFGSYTSDNAQLAERAGLPVTELFGAPRDGDILYGDAMSEPLRDDLLNIVQGAFPDTNLEQIRRSVSVDTTLTGQLQPEALSVAALGKTILTGMKPGKKFDRPLESCRLDYTPGGSTLVISFDNAGAPHREPVNRRPWGHKFLTEEGHAVLGVIAGSSDWYRGRDLHRALHDLREQGFFAHFKQVVLAGSSMGGFGATAFASLAPGSRVISFNPQSTLRRDLVPWDNQHPNGMKQEWSGLFSDGAAEICQASAVYIFFDQFNKFDRRHAKRYRGLQVHHIHAPLLGHGLPDAYHEMGLLKDIMRHGIAGTLDPNWYYPAIRPRKNLIRYHKHIAKPLAESGRMLVGQDLMRRAFDKFGDPFFCYREAVFAAGSGKINDAISILERGDRARRKMNRKK